MMELGLELLLKEPVITKVLFSIFNPAYRLTQSIDTTVFSQTEKCWEKEAQKRSAFTLTF